MLMGLFRYATIDSKLHTLVVFGSNADSVEKAILVAEECVKTPGACTRLLN